MFSSGRVERFEPRPLTRGSKEMKDKGVGECNKDQYGIDSWDGVGSGGATNQDREGWILGYPASLA